MIVFTWKWTKGSRVYTTLTRSLAFYLTLKDCYSVDIDILKTKCQNFSNFYNCDVDGQQLYEEILDFRMLIASRTNSKISRPEEILQLIVQYEDESIFPNLRIAIQIMLTIAVSIASCERSFSKLKLILNYLTASMGQDRLCDLALLC